MKIRLLSIIFFSSAIFAHSPYLKLLEQFPETLGRHGSWKQGEIEVATTPSEIKRIENHCRHRLIRMGYSPEEAEKHTHVGIISEDHYLYWIRDAVTFPGGIPGTYDRIVWKSSLTGPGGVVVFPVLPNKKIVMNINFRHATRSWEMELPRGARKAHETAEQAALRELKEETGCLANKFILLGNVTPDTGILSGAVPVYFGQVREKKERHQDESEAIAVNIDMTIDEIREAFTKGYVIIDIKDEKTKVYCRDPFLSFALLQAMWRKLI